MHLITNDVYKLQKGVNGEADPVSKKTQESKKKKKKSTERFRKSIDLTSVNILAQFRQFKYSRSIIALMIGYNGTLSLMFCLSPYWMSRLLKGSWHYMLARLTANNPLVFLKVEMTL